MCPDPAPASSISTVTLASAAARIRRWLSDCLRDHAGDYCAQPFPGRALRRPKRLVELDPSSSTFRLVNVAVYQTPLKVPRYVALSYVWGAHQNLTTTAATLTRRLAPAPLADLPRTVRDACEVTILLGLRHIWIDALCIVQDDHAEKTVEIANMAAVYWGAWLQIAATRSRGADDGLLPSPHHSTPDDVSRDHRLVMSACRSLKQNVWDDHLLAHYPLLTRGWTFQERILARRCVHFTCLDLVWECKRARWFEGPAAEGTSSTTTITSINNLAGALLQCIRLAHDAPRDPALARTVPAWRQFVMSYSKRRLTDMDDRLLAISGIAGMLRGAALGRGYAAGLWADAMPFDLLWRCDVSSSDRLKETKARGPSWSWCSVDCGVDWPAAEAKEWTRPPHEDPLEYIGRGTYFEQGLEGVRVISVSVDAPAGVFGQVHGGVVDLEARSVPVLVVRRDDDTWKRRHETDWAIQAPGKGPGCLPYYPDMKLPGSSLVNLLFVEVVSRRVDNHHWDAGIVVVVRAKDPNAYERVGMAGRRMISMDDSGPGGWFEGADSRAIRIV